MKFSIIVPIYNVQKYVKECIDSVIGQTFSDFELILVDDGSPDCCPEICDWYAAQDKRIRVIHKKNAGLPAARNSGIKASGGEYLIHLDGDDFLDTSYLASLSMTVESNRNAYFGNSRYDFINGAGIRSELYDAAKFEQMSYDDRICAFFSGWNQMPTATWHGVFKREYIINNNIYFNEELTWSEDKDNFYRIILNTDDFGFFDYTGYYYRKDNTEAMTKNPTLKNYLSALSVEERWFEYVSTADISERAKKTIQDRMANGLVLGLSALCTMSDNDAAIYASRIKKNKDMLSHTRGVSYKVASLLLNIMDPLNLSKIICFLKKRYHQVKSIGGFNA